MKSRKEFVHLLVFATLTITAAVKIDGKKVKGTPTNFFRNLTANKEAATKMLNLQRLYQGTPAEINSMCLLTHSEPWYTLSYTSPMLNFSPQCFITSAIVVSDMVHTPPQPIPGFFTGLCVHPKCDINYHASEIIFNNPYFAFNNIDVDIHFTNSIVIFKTKEAVEYKSQCGSPPMEPAWISCDPEGPPANYTDCFMTSYGRTQPEETAATEFIPANRVPMKILSSSDCDSVSGESDSANSNLEICATGADGMQHFCDESDGLPFLFCNYWKGEPSSGWGWNAPPQQSSGQGWGGKAPPQQSSGQGWGWEAPKKQNLLAVGLLEGGNVVNGESCPSAGVDIFLKFGASSYRQIFSKCGYYCSKDLEKGYRCKGNPPKSLGPVYCMPEKIPTSNNGWSSSRYH